MITFYLIRVTDYEEQNHMYANNLAIVFGPNLLRTRDLAQSISNLGHHSNIVKCLILQYHWFFNVEEEETYDIEYQDDLLDPDMETSDPEDRPTQVTDDDENSSDIVTSENDGTWPTNEINYDESN